MKILLYDIENTPSLGYVWGKYQQDVIDFDKEWYMLSFAYKWLGEKSVKAHSLPEFKTYKKDKEDDKELVKKLWELVCEADILIAHNGDSFDVRKMNARFVYHGLTPPEPYKTIDTVKVARKHFFFNSNKLGDLGKHLGLGIKVYYGGFETWRGCMSGDRESWKEMVKYNKNDVVLLEKIYLKLLPWISNHPVLGNYANNTGTVCPKCSSKKVQSRGFAVNKTTKYRRFQCLDCAGWSRDSKNLQTIRPLVNA